jgi:hypothetical protein
VFVDREGELLVDLGKNARRCMLSAIASRARMQGDLLVIAEEREFLVADLDRASSELWQKSSG